MHEVIHYSILCNYKILETTKMPLCRGEIEQITALPSDGVLCSCKKNDNRMSWSIQNTKECLAFTKFCVRKKGHRNIHVFAYLF